MDNLVSRALTILGAGFVLSVAGIVYLASRELPIPDVLQNLAVGSMGMVGALLVRGGSSAETAKQEAPRAETRA